MTDNQRNTLLKALAQSGVFVSSGDYEQGNFNIMSLHWGSLGTFWNKPSFVLPVRGSKYTHQLIDEHKHFGISVPIKDMRNEIIKCDHMTGHNENKFEELQLHPKRAKHIPVYLVAECGLYLECRVIFTADMNRHIIAPELKADMYENDDYHTMYFAEILACYDAEEMDD